MCAVGNAITYTTGIAIKSFQFIAFKSFGKDSYESFGQKLCVMATINQQIEDEVRYCDQCQNNCANPTRALRPISTQKTNPWSTLHINFSGPYKGHTFMIVVDAISEWLEVKVVLINRLQKLSESCESSLQHMVLQKK